MKPIAFTCPGEASERVQANAGEVCAMAVGARAHLGLVLAGAEGGAVDHRPESRAAASLINPHHVLLAIGAQHGRVASIQDDRHCCSVGGGAALGAHGGAAAGQQQTDDRTRRSRSAGRDASKEAGTD
jgi:hypothetical protein